MSKNFHFGVCPLTWPQWASRDRKPVWKEKEQLRKFHLDSPFLFFIWAWFGSPALWQWEQGCEQEGTVAASLGPALSLWAGRLPHIGEVVAKEDSLGSWGGGAGGARGVAHQVPLGV